VFGRAAANDWGGFRNAAEFFMALRNGKHPNLYGNAMTEGVGSDGGFYVPSALIYGIYDQMIASAEIFQRCLVMPTDTNNAAFPMLDDLDRTTSLGGLRGQWMGELAEGTKQKSRYQLADARLNKLGIFVEASNELLEDAQALANQLTIDMGQALALDLDEALLRGTGVGKPLGLLNAPSTIPIAKESGQVADTIVYENVLKMWARVHPSAQTRGVWMCSPSALPQLLTMVHKIRNVAGTEIVGGSPMFVINASGDTPMTIFGRPLIVTELCSQVGDPGDIIFADWSRYLVLAKRSWRMDVSGDASFMTDASVYRLIARVAGQPMLSGPITPRYGTDTLSWAVTLEERAG
jgi:HK97 family phage major capsid protein